MPDGAQDRGGVAGARAWGVATAVVGVLGVTAVLAALRQGGLAAGAVLGWALFATFACYAVWRVRRRAAELRAVCRAFAEGRYDRRAALGGGALAGLADALNALGARLQETQQELVRSRALLDAALGSLAEGVACLDRLDRVLYANAAWRRLAAAGDDPLGRPWYDHLPAAELQAALRAADGGEAEFQHGRRILSGRFARVGDDLTVLVLHDITSLKRVESGRRDFMAAVSHELKTPLTSVLGFTETLLEGVDDPALVREFIGKIHRHADRLAVLVRDVLTLSRLEQGAWRARPQTIDLVPVARAVLDEFAATAETAKVRLVLDAPESLAITADGELVRMLVANLVSNAVRYNRPEGTVWLRLKPDPAGALVVVEDTGIGIPPEHRERIFERFYRVDSHRSRDTGGTGLGLAIVKHLLQELGGGIGLASDERGTRFDVRLPAQPPEPEAR